MQVRDNTASTMRQYDLVQRALSLGWTRQRIHVIDQDQAHSGSSTIPEICALTDTLVIDEEGVYDPGLVQ